ncbi:hypothetical protein B0H15DRAFT_957250 [Mycena belliarum]|uniref:Uncharacterized protein n=1 Tax=Mycena belliarum TaxID=1033014 RepID=A0AAD6TMT8_9AGAR|nr:hypothetical protein B0H15DRAFT_957250 [Mycena belliae]
MPSPRREKRPHQSLSPEIDSGWTQHPDTGVKGPETDEPPPKRNRVDTLDGSASESDASDWQMHPGWSRYGGDLVTPSEPDIDTESEVEAEPTRYMSDSDHSDDGWHAFQTEDVEMEDTAYDFEDSDSYGYRDPDSGDVDMDDAGAETGTGGEFADDDGFSADTEAGDDTDSSSEEDSGDKRMREHYKSLRNAPPGVPATKNDLAALFRLIHQNGPPTPPIQSNPGRSRKSASQSTPQHRAPDKLYVQRMVRESTRYVMGLPSKDSPVTDDHVPSRAEVARFAKTKLTKHGPQISKLKMKLDVATKDLASLWNKEAAHLLCQYFRQNVVLETPLTDDKIEAMFRVHFQNVRKRYLDGTTNLDSTALQDAADARGKKNESNRTRTLLVQRVRAAEHYASRCPKLEKLLPTIRKLTVDAMSGDEAEHRHGNPRYVVKSLEWRDPTVDLFMTTFDDLHLSTRFKPDRSAGRGKFPHARIRKTARPPVPGNPPSGLPSNFYAANWVASLPDIERRALQMGPSVDLSFSPEILR